MAFLWHSSFPAQNISEHIWTMKGWRKILWHTYPWTTPRQMMQKHTSTQINRGKKNTVRCGQGVKYPQRPDFLVCSPFPGKALQQKTLPVGSMLGCAPNLRNPCWSLRDLADTRRLVHRRAVAIQLCAQKMWWNCPAQPCAQDTFFIHFGLATKTY